MRKMSIIILALAILAAGGLLIAFTFGGHTPRLKIVGITEATKSVRAEAQRESLDAIGSSVNILKRGDELIVLPITADAVNDVQGKTIRHRMPLRRKAFDMDIVQAKKRILADFDTMQDQLAQTAFMHSDLLGSVRIAAEERPAHPADRFLVLMLTDFIQDTRQLNFMTNPGVSDAESAKRLAQQFGSSMDGTFSGAEVFLGQVRSDDLRKLDESRREGIRVFWTEIFRTMGAKEVVWSTDGIGSLATFLREKEVR